MQSPIVNPGALQIMIKKQLFASLALACLTVTGYAQTPEKKARAIVFKFTETWCGPCGSWGWQTAEDVISQLADKGFYIGVMGSSSPSGMNANCADELADNFSIQGYPTFQVSDNGNSQTASQVMSLVNAFAATTPLASPAAVYSISGSTLNVNTKTKFWSAASGEFYTVAYVVEDGVMATQNGQSGTVAHHYIMRGSMATTNSYWGTSVASGSIAANAEYSRNFSMSLNSAWNKSKLSVYVATYKKNGSTYQFINSAKANSGSATSVAEISGLESFQLYPNPSTGNTHLKAELKNATTVTVRITDQLGRAVYTSEKLHLNSGSNNIRIPSEGFAGGVYMVALIAEDGKMNTQRLVIAQ